MTMREKANGGHERNSREGRRTCQELFPHFKVCKTEEPGSNIANPTGPRASLLAKQQVCTTTGLAGRHRAEL